MSATSTHSFSLWMVALTGPNSTSSLATRLMKRPSEVPPVVDSSAWWPVISAMARPSASVSLPGWVRKGWPDSCQCNS